MLYDRDIDCWEITRDGKVLVSYFGDVKQALLTREDLVFLLDQLDIVDKENLSGEQ